MIAFAVTFGPLLWRHVTDPEISQRGAVVGWVWAETDTPLEMISKVLHRYPAHYGPDFLFVSGDKFPGNAPPDGIGLFHWYGMPPMVLGLMILAVRSRTSRAARVVLVWLAFYPLGDLLNEHVSPHSLRSLPGLCGIVLVAAVGAASAGRWLGRRHGVPMLVALGCIASCIVIAPNIYFTERYFIRFVKQKYEDGSYAQDLLEAAVWLRGRLEDVDAVFITSFAVHPDIVTLVGLGYDPNQWFRDVREVVRGPLPGGAYAFEDMHVRIGKLRFMLGPFGDGDWTSYNTRIGRITYCLWYDPENWGCKIPYNRYTKCSIRRACRFS